MNKTAAIFILVVSGLVLGLGLLFLCASAAAPEKIIVRIILAVALMAIGALGAAWAGKVWQRLSSIEPDRLADRILESARAQGVSELTVAEAVASLNAPAANVKAAFDVLDLRGDAHPEGRQDRTVYVFPGLKARKVERRCPYCGAEFPVKQAISICPNCGGKVELGRT